MKHKAWVWGLALSLLAGAATADPLLGAGAMAPTLERALQSQMRADRRAHPQAWQAVSSLQGIRPGVYRATRLQRPSVSRELRALGPDALLPMLDALAGAGFGGALSPAEREALTVGMLEAVGVLRDPRALPVLSAAYERASGPTMLRAAARGLAMSGDPAALARVQRGASEGELAQRATSLAALGVSPNPAVTPWLVARLAAPEPALVEAAAAALGERHSAWAATARRQNDPDRALVARSLVASFLRADPAHERALQTAVLAVGGAETLAAIDALNTGAAPRDAARLATLRRLAARQ
ncbi:MAG: hypothetical protein JNK72_08930 [Myxococcales bacterium]|nr:hypothetical protein [Myxococcales bacterium]